MPTPFEKGELVAFPLLHLRQSLHEGLNTGSNFLLSRPVIFGRKGLGPIIHKALRVMPCFIFTISILGKMKKKTASFLWLNGFTFDGTFKAAKKFLIEHIHPNVQGKEEFKPK